MSTGFKKAERKQVKIKIAISGPSGSGKSYSALLIAKGIARKPNGTYGRIAVLDSENDSASLYAGLPGMPEFDSMGVEAPFHTDKYLRGIKAAVDAGYDVLVIDSGSHQWAGEGGILDRKDKEQLAKPGANSFTLWAKYTPEHESFKAAINQAPIHVIMTMRSKQEYAIEQSGGEGGGRGKATPKKVGMAPVQREGQEYEFTVAFDMSMENLASVSKDRTSLFSGQFFKPSEETGRKIIDWLASGKAEEPKAPPLTAEEQMRVGALRSAHNKVTWPEGSIADYCTRAFNEASPLKITDEQFHRLLGLLQSQTAAQARVGLAGELGPLAEPGQPGVA